MEQFRRGRQVVHVDASDLREYRKSLRETQFCFWSRFGVTQSRGSRFEMGAEIPSPVAILLKLFMEGVITDQDLSGAPTNRMPARQNLSASYEG